ncbi:hypothetical protein GCM10010247_45820 [Streptomyces calvus]|nr:hypothetical protein GCM10010247_45820 [Streptomyces calvus]
MIGPPVTTAKQSEVQGTPPASLLSFSSASRSVPRAPPPGTACAAHPFTFFNVWCALRVHPRNRAFMEWDQPGG